MLTRQAHAAPLATQTRMSHGMDLIDSLIAEIVSTVEAAGGELSGLTTDFRRWTLTTALAVPRASYTHYLGSKRARAASCTDDPSHSRPV